VPAAAWESFHETALSGRVASSVGAGSGVAFLYKRYPSFRPPDGTALQVRSIAPGAAEPLKFPGVASGTPPLAVCFRAMFEYPDTFGTSSLDRMAK